MRNKLYIFGIFVVTCFTNNIAVLAVEGKLQSSIASASSVHSYTQGQSVDLEWNSFVLQADSGALLHNLELSFELLREEQVPRMPSYMVNVTGDNVGAYRLLPNGVHFEEAATITVPYDEYLLPMGYKAKDVKTYYFDEELAQWNM